MNDILKLLNAGKKPSSGNKKRSGDDQIETTLEQLLKLRELGKEASASAQSELAEECVIQDVPCTRNGSGAKNHKK